MRYSIVPFLFVFVCFPLGIISSKTVSKELAIQVALHYTNLHTENNDSTFQGLKSPPYQVILSSNDTNYVEQISFTDEAYMWLVPTIDGWYLVSSNTKTTPLFAYFPTSLRPTISEFSPAAKDLLIAYETSIAKCDSIDDTKESLHQEEWNSVQNVSLIQEYSVQNKSVAPLLRKNGRDEVLWNQSGPTSYCDMNYNKFCPPYENSSCGKAVVGCVAVAMAQLMHYWEWPYSANIPTTVGGNVSDLHIYDWTKTPLQIIEGITPLEHVDMIAGLLRDCGYSVNMHYGETSSAWDHNALKALHEIFAYSDEMKLIAKAVTPNWETFLLAELYAKRPVFYSGHLPNGKGHAFIVEGYDATTSSYYVNFGWGGISNGYYRLNDIDGYRYNQQMIIGIKPQPICASEKYSKDNYNDISNSFSFVHGEEIVLENIGIGSQRGVVYSGTQVRLRPGCWLKKGSNVHIAIKDIPCNNRNRSVQAAPALRSSDNAGDMALVSLPNQQSKKVAIAETDQIIFSALYSVSGQLVQSVQGDGVNLQTLPQGFYILQRRTDRGNVLVEKVAVN